ncbi:uncharacterized protein LOC123014738 isoform X4 [Tribolium madens]|uniref:uncharacterized protein LOC123014738 isoform X4 n=1 Tax=Tribolium madens TaxID=41895 RepID=UPI001CF75A3B|nr:uncharacterized protein LOC123014738 isoform X4 [Tribolium madens]
MIQMEIGRKPGFPGSLTDLHRFRKTVHGHDGSSRIVMVRKTDQRTFASKEKGQEPKLETITRETIETFRGQRTECKITTEKKGCEDKFPSDLIESLQVSRTPKRTLSNKKKRNPVMEFEQECLAAHNEYRRRHGVPPLKLDREMCKVSQQWANHLISRNILQHSNNKDYGENLFCMTSSNPKVAVSGKEPVDAWYGEIKDHTFGTEPTSLASGHFTQVVWKTSAKLGVAFAKSGGRVVVVANYDPPGNYVGNFSKNVPPVGGFSGNNNNNNNEDCSEALSKLSIKNGSTKSFPTSKDVKNGTEGNFEADFINAHNEYRRRHGVPPLKLDKKLCKYSEEWAKHLAAKNILEHRPSCNYGENIFCMSSSDPNFTISGNTPVDHWYEEVRFHPFGREPNSLKSGHFTQVVWKSSELLGVGVAKNSQGSIYVVANYSPAGNFVGHYVENVPPLTLTPKTESTDKKVLFSQGTNNDGFNQFALDGLKVHNEYRRKHGVPDLKLNKELCDYAQEWADTCAKSGSMCHRANNPYGENIFCVYSSDLTHVPSARDAVKEWYDEIKKHSFGVESVNHGTLHFTQIIWKGSTDLGIAMAKNKKGETYVVANYNPRGNYVGQFVDNVPRPRF